MALMISEDRSLELSPEEFRHLVDRAVKRIIRHVASLSDQAAADVDGGADLARSLVEPLPRKGQQLEGLLAQLFDELIPKSFNTAGPGYLAFIPGGGLLHSAVADLISASVNRYVGVWTAAPGLAQLEANVIRWFCDIVGYPQQARGFLSSGGSLANFSALLTARRERLPDDFLGGTIYVSEEVHHSVQKAAMLAGFPLRNVRSIASDQDFRIRLDELEDRIRSDRKEGWTPFLVVGSAGTTNTGAVDDLQALAELARDESMWFHVDAAYGGFFMLTQRGRSIMKGLERADSMVLDPHKGFFVPYGTGSLLVRDGEALRRAHSVQAAYMPTLQQDGDLVDFCEISPELSRAFRGLRIWLPLKLHGIEPFRRNLEEKLDLAEWATDKLQQLPCLEIVAPPQLSVVAFRLRPEGLEGQPLEALNRRFLDRINARKRVFLTASTVKQGFILRICVLSYRTHLDRMQAALEDIEAAAKEVLAEAGGSRRSQESGGRRQEEGDGE